MKYGHGGDIYSQMEQGRNVLDFSSNINPLGLPEQVKKVWLDIETLCTAYPDPCCRELCRAIAEYEAVSPEMVVCGNGAADLIFRLTYGLRPRRTLVLAPTFSEYEKAAVQAGSVMCYHELREENEFAVTDDLLLTIAKEKPDMVFLCNPNNPTGKLMEKKLLIETAALCEKQGCVLVVDECFLDFCSREPELTMKRELQRYSGLVILKAFTKFFALAGLRLGYLMTADSKIQSCVEKAGQPWSVSTPAQRCGIAALTDKNYIACSKEQMPELRNTLMSALSALPLKVYCGEANYLLLQTQIPDFYKQMLEQGILIRCCGNYRGLSEIYYRVAVKSADDNLRLAEAVKRICAQEETI